MPGLSEQLLSLLQELIGMPIIPGANPYHCVDQPSGIQQACTV